MDNYIESSLLYSEESGVKCGIRGDSVRNYDETTVEMPIDREDDTPIVGDHIKSTLKRDETENNNISEMLSDVNEDYFTLPHYRKKETDGNMPYSVNDKELDTTLHDAEENERLVNIPGDASDDTASYPNEIVLLFSLFVTLLTAI